MLEKNEEISKGSRVRKKEINCVPSIPTIFFNDTICNKTKCTYFRPRFDNPKTARTKQERRQIWRIKLQQQNRSNYTVALRVAAGEMVYAVILKKKCRWQFLLNILWTL